MRKELPAILAGLVSSKLFTGRQGEITGKAAQIGAETFDYQVYVPPESKNVENLPLIVFLHGIRERGSGGFIPREGMFGTIVKQYLKAIPAIVLLPQCRPGKYWSDPVMDQMVIKAIEQSTAEFRADAKKISLLGVSMGGYGVWHFGANYPEKFAALVSICGGSPLMSGDRFTPIAKKIGKIPAWLFHGTEDTIVPVSESREIYNALKANGGDIKYSEYAGVGHNVWLNALNEKDLMPWILTRSLSF